MDPLDKMAIIRQDYFYVEEFCHRYKTRVVSIFPNNEDFPPKGLIYVFDNQLGGFSIDGVKNSLWEDSLEDKISE